MSHPHRCLGCGYILHGLPQPRCPECGLAFDPNDPTTFDKSDPRRQSPPLLLAAPLLAIMAMLGLTSPWIAARMVHLAPDAVLAALLVVGTIAGTLAAAVVLSSRWLPAAAILLPACGLIAIQAIEFRMYYSLAASVIGPVLGAICARALKPRS